MHTDLYRKVEGPDGGPDSVQSETVLLRKVNENFIHQHFVTLSEWAIPDLQNRFTVYLAPVCVCVCVCLCVCGVCVYDVLSFSNCIKNTEGTIDRQSYTAKLQHKKENIKVYRCNR